MDVSEGDVFDFACYKNVNFVCGTNSFQSDGAHTQNIPVNHVTYNIRRIKISGEIRTDEVDDETNGCFLCYFL